MLNRSAAEDQFQSGKTGCRGGFKRIKFVSLSGDTKRSSGQVELGEPRSSQRERVLSSPNCESSAGVKARHLFLTNYISQPDVMLAPDERGTR